MRKKEKIMVAMNDDSAVEGLKLLKVSFEAFVKMTNKVPPDKELKKELELAYHGGITAVIIALEQTHAMGPDEFFHILNLIRAEAEEWRNEMADEIRKKVGGTGPSTQSQEEK